MASLRWAYVRIISGTILGGVLGFYVMHRVETSYKERRKEEMKRYEMSRRQEQQQAQAEDKHSSFGRLFEAFTQKWKKTTDLYGKNRKAVHQKGKEGFFF